jgi:hypothetical protein
MGKQEVTQKDQREPQALKTASALREWIAISILGYGLKTGKLEFDFSSRAEVSLFYRVRTVQTTSGAHSAS